MAISSTNTNPSNRNSSSSVSSTRSNYSDTSAYSGTSEKRQYYLAPTTAMNSHPDAQLNLDAEKWRKPYTIDDADLTFDGKPLNILHEENRYYAEHGYGGGEKVGELYLSHFSSRCTAVFGCSTPMFY